MFEIGDTVVIGDMTEKSMIIVTDEMKEYIGVSGVIANKYYMGYDLTTYRIEGIAEWWFDGIWLRSVTK